jgi:two-component sensor histidine kinase
VLTNCRRNTRSDDQCHHWVFYVGKERSLFEDELLQAKKRAESTSNLLQASEKELQQSLRDKESLIKEVHHRVKNNLQIITSLLRLESGRSEASEVKSVLGDMQNRIRTMSTLHETLYRTTTLGSVDLGSYLRQLSIQAFRTQAMNPEAVRLDLELESVQVGMDQAVTCGLLVNELVSNCLKHGFPSDHSGRISVTLQPIEAAQQWRLCVSDTGVGLPANFEEKRKDSLGLQLVVDLARQLGGKLDIAPNLAKGVAFTVDFKVAEPVLDQVNT